MTSRTTKRILAAAVLAILVLGVLGAYAARIALRERTLTRALEAGMAAHGKRDYAEGMKQLAVYVGRVKTNSQATLALADCRRNVPLENAEHLMTALTYARAAARVAPNDARPLEMVMELCSQLGFATEAREAAEKLLALDPRHHDALMTKARVLLAVGEASEALECAQIMAEQYPDLPESHDLVVGAMRSLKKDPQDIYAYAAKVRTTHTANLGLALFECRVAMSTGNSAGAVSSARHASQLPVQDATELSALVRLLDLLRAVVTKGEDPLPTPDEVLARAAEMPSLENDAAFLKAERAWKSGQLEAAAKCLPALDDKMSDTQLGLHAVMKDLNGSGGKDATATLEKRSGDDAAYWAAILRGRASLAESDLKGASRELADATTRNASPGYAQFFLGEALARAGDWRAAAKNYDAAALTDPTWRTARFASIALLAKNGRFDEARQEAKDAIAKRPFWPELHMYFEVSVSMLEAGRGDKLLSNKTIDELERAHAENSENSTIAALRARALLASNREREAAQISESLLTVDPPPPADSLMRLMAGFQRTGNPVAERLQAVIDRTSSTPSDAAGAKARGLVAAGRPSEAVSLLSQAAAAAEGAQRTRLLLLLGQLQDATGDSNAAGTLAGLAAAEDANAELQLAVLECQSVWSDRSTIDATLGRLKKLVGEDAAAFIVFDCRRRLTFPPSAPQERNAEAAKIVKSLTELISPLRPGPLRTDRREVLPSLLLAEAQTTLDDRTGAIATLLRCINAEPSAAAAYPMLIGLLQQDGRPDDAAQHLASFRTIKNLPLPIQRQRAKLLAIQGMRSEYSQELADLASHGVAQDRLACAAERADAEDAATAKRLFDELVAEPSVTVPTLAAAAEFAAAHDGINAGLAVLDRAGPALDQSELGRVRAGLLARYGRGDDAEVLLRQRTSDNSSSAWADLAEFYLSANRLDEAASAVHSGFRIAPKDDRLIRLDAMVKLRAGMDTAGAHQTLSAMFNSPNARPDLRAVAAALQDYDKHSDSIELIASLAKVTKKYPASFDAWQQLVSAYGRAGQPDNAARAALSAAQSIPGNPRAAKLATETLAQAGRIEEASAMAARWRSLAPGDASDVDLVQARLKCLRGQFDDAIKMLRPYESQILAAAKDRPQDLELCAAALAAAGRVDEAAQIVGDRFRSDPAWSIRYLRIGEAVMRRPDQARAWLLRLNLDANASGELLLAAAQTWLKLGAASGTSADSDEGVQYALRAAAIANVRGPASALLADVYAQRGQPEHAIDAYRIARKELPGDPDVANNLAYILTTRPADYKEAAELAATAISLAEKHRIPDSQKKSYFDTQGIAELRLGRFREAEAAFRAGLAMDRDAMDLNIGLVEALIGQNQFREAQQLVDRVSGISQGSQGLAPDLSARLNAVRERLAAGE